MTNHDQLLQVLKAHQADRKHGHLPPVPEDQAFRSELAAAIARLDEQHELIAALVSENQFLAQRISALEIRMPPQLDGGRLPDDMSDLECQIFYTPLEMIPTAHRRVKTEWSLRLTAYIGGKRAKPDLNIRLYSGSKFWCQVMELVEHPPQVEQAAEAIRDTDALGGMLMAITKQKGRPYIPTQFCTLTGHLANEPKVLVGVDGREIVFHGFRPGKGTKSNRAKWYAKVQF